VLKSLSCGWAYPVTRHTRRSINRAALSCPRIGHRNHSPASALFHHGIGFLSAKRRIARGAPNGPNHVFLSGRYCSLDRDGRLIFHTVALIDQTAAAGRRSTNCRRRHVTSAFILIGAGAAGGAAPQIRSFHCDRQFIGSATACGTDRRRTYSRRAAALELHRRSLSDHRRRHGLVAPSATLAACFIKLGQRP
jgi:hypothetical protein